MIKKIIKIFTNFTSLHSKVIPRVFQSTMVKAQKIGTHDGAFHADEVLACTMLKMLPEFADAEIVRTRKPELLDECDIVVDVGGVFDHEKKRYDHHQKTFTDSVSSLIPEKKWTTKLSSAGLIYVHYGKDIIREILKEKSTDELVEKIFDKVYSNFIEEQCDQQWR